MVKHTATKLSTPGSTPVYDFRGYRIVNSAGSRWGRGWIYEVNGVVKYASTLESAKFFINLFEDKGLS